LLCKNNTDETRTLVQMHQQLYQLVTIIQER